MARFYSNENIPAPVVSELRQLGHEVVTSAEAGNANRAVPDSEVLAFAIMKQLIVLTHNRRHFLRLYAQLGSKHHGIVVCTFDPNFPSQAKRIDSAVASECDMTGKVLRVNRPS